MKDGQEPSRWAVRPRGGSLLQTRRRQEKADLEACEEEQEEEEEEAEAVAACEASLRTTSRARSLR